MIDFIIWNASPILFSLGPFVLRWYGIFFVLGFFLGRIVLASIYRKENKPLRDVETLTWYILLAALIGSRLGYVLFYQPELVWTQPLEIFLPIGFRPGFHFTGLEKLSGQGALFGVLLALGLYSRKGKPGQNFLQVLDRVSIPLLLCTLFIGLGNFFNGEIIGMPTDAPVGVVATRPVTDGLLKVPCCIMRNPGGANPLDAVSIKKDTAVANPEKGYSPLILYLFFTPGATEQQVNEFLIGDVKTFLFDNGRIVYEPGTDPLHYTIFQEKEDIFTARIRTTGIARHPTPVYEALAFLLLLFFSSWYGKKRSETLATGMLGSLFLIAAGLIFFATGFLKEDQASFEAILPLNMGQITSIALVLMGAIILILIGRRRSGNNS